MLCQCGHCLWPRKHTCRFHASCRPASQKPDARALDTCPNIKGRMTPYTLAGYTRFWTSRMTKSKYILSGIDYGISAQRLAFGFYTCHGKLALLGMVSQGGRCVGSVRSSGSVGWRFPYRSLDLRPSLLSQRPSIHQLPWPFQQILLYFTTTILRPTTALLLVRATRANSTSSLLRISDRTRTLLPISAAIEHAVVHERSPPSQTRTHHPYCPAMITEASHDTGGYIKVVVSKALWFE